MTPTEVGPQVFVGAPSEKEEFPDEAEVVTCPDEDLAEANDEGGENGEDEYDSDDDLLSSYINKHQQNDNTIPL